MAKAVIHIGMGKTGTTYIQDACVQLRPELAALGICFPAMRRLPSGNHFLFAWAHGFSSHAITTDAQSTVAWDVMADDLPGPQQTLLLSSDFFARHKPGAAIGRLKAWLATNGFDDVRIVVFLRNQVAWLISAYGESMKWGSRKTVEEFYRPSRLIYGNLLSRWTSAFGEDNLIVVNYDAARRTDRTLGIMDALWSAVGVDPTDRAALVPRKPVASNAHYSQTLLESLRRCALSPGALQKGYNFAAATLDRWRAQAPRPIHAAPIWPLPAAFLADLPDMQRDNEAIARTFGIPALPDLGETASAYQATVVPMPEREVARCAALVTLGAAGWMNRVAAGAAAVQAA